MKAISVRQPWAWAITFAGKDIENRNWPTRYRGPVLIHAAKGMTRDEDEDCLHALRDISRVRPFPTGLALPAFEELDRGGIIGYAEITDCISRSGSPWFAGSYGFVLANPQPLPFQPYRGQLG